MKKSDNTLLLVGLAAVAGYAIYKYRQNALTVAAGGGHTLLPPVSQAAVMPSNIASVVNPGLSAGLPSIGDYLPSVNPIGETITFY